MKVALVRGAFLNNFEGQNYSNLPKSIIITGFSSLSSIHKAFPFPVVRLPSLTDIMAPRWLANRTIGDNQILFGLKKAVQGYDVVHTADPHYYYSYQLAKMRRDGIIKRLISTSWETIPFNNESVLAKKRIKYFSMKYIDEFLCYTSRAKNSLIKEGVDPKKITVVPLGVNLRKFRPDTKKSTDLKRNNLRILFTGRDVPEKGLSDLRSSVKHLTKDFSVELLVAGNLPYEKMPDAYRLADIFVMPSKSTKTWEEQYGMSLIEAMASGLPIVAYGSGSIPELLGASGILVPEGDERELTDAIKNLVTSQMKREKLGKSARNRAEKLFDSKKFGKSISKFYSES